MQHKVTTDAVVAFTQCQRKAYYLLRGDQSSRAHDLELALKNRAAVKRSKYLDGLESNLLHQLPFSADADLQFKVSADDLISACDAITQANGRSVRSGGGEREPHLVVGTSKVSKEQELAAAFAGHVIGQIEGIAPSFGIVVPFSGGRKRSNLTVLYPQIRSIVEAIRKMSIDSAAEPPLLLCAACATCQFRDHCYREAEETDNLTLLHRMTPALMKKYAQRGVFTVNQLSYMFRPRRARKRSAVAPSTFNVELQALAIRNKKTYLHEAPKLSGRPVELYLDIEGIPDQNFNYLIGLMIKDHDGVTMKAFWADTVADESRIFQECIDTINTFPPDIPVYHYGSYEPRAFQSTKDAYGIKCDTVMKKLVNINSMIYGKIYFPTRSNRLKDLGAHAGATSNSKRSTTKAGRFPPLRDFWPITAGFLSQISITRTTRFPEDSNGALCI